ncbi:MAG: PAS domain S-box protein [Chitinophagaceae bacterium]
MAIETDDINHLASAGSTADGMISSVGTAAVAGDSAGSTADGIISSVGTAAVSGDAAGSTADSIISSGFDWTRLLDATKHGTFLLDRNLHIVYMNEAAKRILSYVVPAGTDLKKTSFPGLMPEERRGKALHILGQVLAGNAINYETSCVAEDGRFFWFEMDYRPIANPQGIVEHILINSIDITENKKQQAATLKSEQRWKFVVEGDGNGVWEINTVTKEAYCSTFLKAILGYSEEDNDNSLAQWNERVHPDDLYKLINLHALYIKQVIQHHSLEFRIRKKNDEYAWVLNRGMVMEKLQDGLPLRIAGTQKDITSSKNAEEALRQSEERYYQMVDHIEDYSIMMLDTSGKILNWNKGAEKIKGYKSWEILGKSFLIFYRKEDVERGLPQSLLEEAFRTGRAFGEGWRIKKDGSAFWASVSISQVKDRDDNLIGFSKITRDLTEKKIAEDKLIKSEFQFSSFMAHTPTMNWIIDENAIFRYLNDSYMKAFDLNKDHIGKSIYEIFPARICDEYVANNWKVWRGGKAIDTYEEGICPDGTKRFYHSYKFPLPADENGIKLLGGVSLDLTKQRILENELATEEDKRKRDVINAIIEAQEKERKNIAYELHDNVNQILTSSRLMLEVAAEKPDSFDKFVNNSLLYLQNAIREVRRISHSLAPGTLNDIGLEDAIEEVTNDVNKTGQLSVRYKKRILHSTRDVSPEIQLTLLRIVQEQLRNIIKHADSGSATVILKCTKQRISVRIVDEGRGFDPRTAKKGLGLNGIYNRTEYFNGKVLLESEPGNGCSLTIQIPLENS